MMNLSNIQSCLHYVYILNKVRNMSSDDFFHTALVDDIVWAYVVGELGITVEKVIGGEYD